MKIKLDKTSCIVVLGMALWVLSCIREDVELPPVLDTLTANTFISGNIVSLHGNHLGSSTRVFINDTIVSVQGEPTANLIQFIVPFVQSKTETFIYVTTSVGSSVSQPISILPPLPWIKTIMPNRASINHTIKIIGSYFKESPLVQFKSADQTQWLDATPLSIGDTLKVVVPEGLNRDAADIRVKTLSGESEPASFDVLVAPEILTISHTVGGPGMIITITGIDFDYVQQVLFGKIPAEIVSNTSDKLLVRIPDGAKTDSLMVETEGGVDTYQEKFIITPKPEVTAFDRKSGRAGMELNITGMHFSDVYEIRFGNTPAEIKIKTATNITTTIPNGAGSGKIYILGPGGTYESEENFIIEGAPLIHSFEPQSGFAGTEILLTGLNLSAVTEAYLGAQKLELVKIPGVDNQLKVIVRDPAVTGKISVHSPGGTFRTSSDFNVPGSVKITSVSPTAGPPGTIVTIVGENFPANPTVKFFDAVVATVSNATPTEILCQVPVDASNGEVNVNGALSSDKFIVVVAPTITKIEPMQGAVGKEIAISGTNLQGAAIKFDNTDATPISSTNTKLLVKVPLGATTGKISVITEGGTRFSEGNFTVIFPPTITSFSPAHGAVGTMVSIIGTNLQHNPVVQFFSQVTATIKSVSPTQILVEVPNAASGNEKISIKTDAVNSPIFSALPFAIMGKPTINSIFPAAGTIKEKVTINGSNFNNLVSVSFDGVTTSLFLSQSANQVTVEVPEGLNAISNRTINLSVKTTSDVSGNISFKLLGTPTITSLSPNNNPAGWAFLIKGTNLNNVRKLSLNDNVPTVGTQGIQQQAFNYITTKVPSDITVTSDQNMILKLHYTLDGIGFTPENFKVLSVPPPGVFPPPNIILPAPIPSSYVQVDLSDYWINKHYQSPSPDSVLSCYQLRANFIGEPPSGDFCEINKFYAKQVGGSWTEESDVVYGTGNWNNGKVTLNYSDGIEFNGQVLDNQSRELVLEGKSGHQLILVHDKNQRCQTAHFGIPGPCTN